MMIGIVQMGGEKMLTHDDYMQANSKEYVDKLPRAKRDELIRSIREGRPDDCMSCLFFKWTDDGRQTCALGYDEEIDLRMRDKMCPIGGAR
jgi:hypothetical protein